MPVNVDVGLDGVFTVPPVPLTILHAPVPAVGAFAANVTCVKPHVVAPVWSVPAFAVVGFLLKVIFTSSVEAVQGEFDIVHRNT